MKVNNILAIIALLASSSVFSQSPNESRTETHFESLKANQHKLIKFLRAMPKGGDLHNHESGATYAENMLRYSYNDNLCLNRITYAVFVDPKCENDNLLDNAIKDANVYDGLIDAWSMRHFTTKLESGHDHFFATFGKFGTIANQHRGEILAELVTRAAAENESYLELMITADGNESGRLGKKLGWDPNFDKMRARLLDANFDSIISNITNSLNQDETKMKSILACDASQPKSGCKVKVRYLYQVLREQDPESVFAQLLAGFEAAGKDSRVVGLNMVQAEDGKISMRDYKLHMQMVGYLHKLYPKVHISLHAGELNDALVTPEGLKFHINDAVYVANANRIGHGVDIAKEDQAPVLMSEMAKRHVMVEINLSSNASILGIERKNHPLPLYMQYGVPVSLSTDDEGVSRSNIVKEYERAVNDFGFDYLTLKNFARNSLTYSFLSGDALWVDYDYHQVVNACQQDSLGSDTPSATCAAFLKANEKASMQWDLENRFETFESKFSH